MRMTGVVTWVVDSGDGVFIERGRPSIASKLMPHYTTYGGNYFSGPGGTTFFTDTVFGVTGSAGPSGDNI